jgi:UDP-N-acetylglucosamine 2-epimerase (non-hydrolysing)
MRDESERPEAITAGVAKLVGPCEERIVSEAATLLDDAEAYARMSAGACPYGDGKAAPRIVQAIQQFLGAGSISADREDEDDRDIYPRKRAA